MEKKKIVLDAWFSPDDKEELWKWAAVFACLGLLLAWLVSMGGRTGIRLACPVLLGGLLAAGVDEAIQLLVPERGPSLRDVGIDVCGVVVGLILFLLGYNLRKYRQK